MHAHKNLTIPFFHFAFFPFVIPIAETPSSCSFFIPNAKRALSYRLRSGRLSYISHSSPFSTPILFLCPVVVCLQVAALATQAFSSLMILTCIVKVQELMRQNRMFFLSQQGRKAHEGILLTVGQGR